MISQIQVYYFQVAFAAFGIFVNLTSLATHFLVPGFRKHPGSIIVMIIMCQIVFLSHWVLAFPYEIV